LAADKLRNRPALDKVMVGELIDLVSVIGMGEPGEPLGAVVAKLRSIFLPPNSTQNAIMLLQQMRGEESEIR
jgi:hypothetical protein